MPEKTETPPGPTHAVIEYENLDVAPVYVEGVQGMTTPQGSLVVSFFSERMKSKQSLEGSIQSSAKSSTVVTMNIQAADPFGMDGDEVRIVRRIEANLILTPPALRRITEWLKAQVDNLK